MKDIDWSKAPEGATHAGKTSGGDMCWYIIRPETNAYKYKYDTDSVWGTNDGTGLGPRHKPLIPRPTQWKGPQDGWPPVGTECEYTFKAHTDPDYCEWDRCIIQYRSDYGIVIKEVWGAEAFFSHEHYDILFRAIKSERDVLVEKAVAVFKKQHPDLGDTMQAVYAGNLFDAGMLVDPERKPMSRAEANNAISIALSDVSFSVKHRTALLDALGYKD